MDWAKSTPRIYSARLKSVTADARTDSHANPRRDSPADEAKVALTPEQVFRRYSTYVAAVAFRILGRDDQIDDVVQDVFMIALKQLNRLRDPDAVKSWLATITVRCSSRRLRLRRLRLLLGIDQAPRYEEVIAPTAHPETRVLLGQIYAFLDELPVEKRLAWILRHIQGEPLDEVARLCDCSLSAAKRRIDAADQALQRMLADE
jgi:RNA polymerase sigma-70 factor (ECF subfamily)